LRTALPSALVAAVLVWTAPANASDGDDARTLFGAGQYRAAAAAFEARWEASHDAHEGLNAVIALRSAGAYAHGLALLDRVRAESPSLPPDVASRARLLDATLHDLTGTLALDGEGLPSEATLEVDGASAWRSGGAIVVDVGRREVSIVRPGCDVFRWAGTVRPGQRVSVPVSFTCHALPGSIHVNLSGAAGARIQIDGSRFDSDAYDFDTPEAPGEHRVQIKRRGIVLADESVTVPPGTSVSVSAHVPWRAKATGIVLGATTEGIAATSGTTGAVGVVFGYQALSFSRLIDPGPTLELLVMLGTATTGVGEGAAPRVWLGMTAGVANLLPTLWQRRTGKTTWIFDFEPTLATFQAAPISESTGIPGVDATASVTYLGLMPVVVTAEFPFAHAELAVFPAGVVLHRGWSLIGEGASEVTHAASLALTIGWKVLGD
jgi:hypothetical protein